MSVANIFFRIRLYYVETKVLVESRLLIFFGWFTARTTTMFKNSIFRWTLNSLYTIGWQMVLFCGHKTKQYVKTFLKKTFSKSFWKNVALPIYKRKIKEAIFFQSKKHISEFFTLYIFFFSNNCTLTLYHSLCNQLFGHLYFSITKNGFESIC